jgi:superfamily II DNA or RNA helicase
MYRSTLGALRELCPAMLICGFSATPFRLDSGLICEGEDRIFDEVIFDYDIAQGIADGWLSPLSSKGTRTTIDVRGVGKRGGEFIADQLERAADVEEIVGKACDEMVHQGIGRNCWLVFCCGIGHALHVRDALRQRGVSCEAVFGETAQEERERIIADFRAGRIKCLVNINVLTTGFNVPQIDLLAMLRPTLSTGLLVQMVGRGSRKAEGKIDCLILDFAGNILRHGPIDCLLPSRRKATARLVTTTNASVWTLYAPSSARNVVSLIRWPPSFAEHATLNGRRPSRSPTCAGSRRSLHPRTDMAAGNERVVPPACKAFRSVRTPDAAGGLSLRLSCFQRLSFLRAPRYGTAIC